VGTRGEPKATTRRPKWTDEAEALLREWGDRAAAAKKCHYELVESYRSRHTRLGIPVVILSSLVGTSLFATLGEPEVSQVLRLVAGLVSVVAAVLAGVQTFLRYSELAERHMIAADWYAACQRRVEQLLALPSEDRVDPAKALDEVRKELARIGQHSPEIGERRWREITREFRLRETTWHPEEVGGAVETVLDRRS
jgi:hypothetical protein